MKAEERRALGRRLRAVRTTCGYTWGQVASAVGATREEMLCVETGARSVSVGLLERLASLYGCSPIYFLLEAEPVDSGAIALRAKTLSTGQRREFETWARKLINNYVDLADLVREMEDAGR